MNRVSRITITFLLFFSTVGYLNAQDSKVKAAFIYQFGRIIEWPDSGDSFIIGVIGTSDINDYLSEIAVLKTIGTKQIVIKEVSVLSEALTCNIVFIHNDKKAILPTLSKAVDAKSILIVTESDGLAQKESAINFVNVNGKILFEINKLNISNSKLNFPLSLERIANKVY
jgi:hypothetical protein